MIYRLTVFLSHIFLKIFFRLNIRGQEAFPKDKPFILASNHVSHLDPVVLGVACPRKINFLAKEELFSNKIFGAYLKTLNVIPLKRKEADIKVMRMALKILKEKPMLIFPQGTRGAAYDKSKAGVGFLCKKARVAVVAAKVCGTDKILPKGARFMRRGKIRVIFKRVNNIHDVDSYEEITSKVMETIKNL